jgi:glycosyltransferase involved in cell wall biosynthesis
LAGIAEKVGVLVPPAEPARLAQALTRLADNPDLRGQLGLRGRAYAEARLSKDAILSEFSQSVENLVQRNGKKRRDV